MSADPKASSSEALETTAPDRGAARLAAVQALYQMELTGQGADVVVNEFRHHRLGAKSDDGTIANANPEFFAELVRGVMAERDELDDMVAAVLSADVGVDRLETVLKVVLRAGAFELSSVLTIPVRVIIAEYVDIADAYFGPKQTALANAVLDRIARALRSEELEEDSRGRSQVVR